MTEEEKRAKRLDALARGRATQAAKRAAKSAQPVENIPVAATAEPDPDALTVDVSGLPEPPKVSLMERMFGKFQGGSQASTSTKKAGRPAKKRGSDNLITTALPTVIASFVATYSSHLLPKEYKACAPSMEEVSAVLSPLLAIIGRRVEIAGRASQDVIDLTNSVIAGLMYGTRAFMVYMQIKMEKQEPGYAERIRREYREQLEREARNYQDESVRTAGFSSEHDEQGGAVHRSNGVSHSDNGGSQGTASEADIIAAMFARDKRGRAQLGLLPA